MFALLFHFFIIFWLVLFFFRFLTGKRSKSVTCLIGKTALITGGNSGLGYATAVLLASRGCKIIIADVADTKKSVEEIKNKTKNPNISGKFLDLSSFKSIREFSDNIKKFERKIDILVNNAGVLALLNKTSDGFNSIMQINYLGHFLLTHLLLEPLKNAGSSRIIFLGSVTSFIPKVNENSLTECTNSNALLPNGMIYGKSKLFCMMAAQEFGKKLQKFGITANSADPGYISSNIHKKDGIVNYRIIDVIDKFLTKIASRGTFMGAQTIFDLASNSELEGKTSGNYCLCKPWFKPSILKNQKFCDEIWKQSEILCQLKEEEKI